MNQLNNNKQKRWPTALQQLLPVITVLILALLAYIFEQQLINSLVYKRELIAQWEIWRIFSSHFFHTNLNHLLLNLGGLLLLWSLHGQYYTIKNYFLFFISSSIIVSYGLYLFSPELSQYVGLSGVLHGVFIWGGLTDIRHKIMSGYLLVIGILLKVIHEQVYGAGQDIAELINANVAIDAHLWGVVSGILFFILSSLLSIKTRKNKNAK